MALRIIQWYNKAHEFSLLKAELQFYRLVTRLAKGLYLDISCGLGYCLFFKRGVGCDFSRKSIEQARLIAPNSDFLVCDAHYLPFRTGVFDTISCLGSLEHYLDPSRTIKEVRRVLRNNGILLISITNTLRWTKPFRMIFSGKRQPIENALSVRRAVQKLSQHGFRVLNVMNPHQFNYLKYANLPILIGVILNKIDVFLPTAISIEPLYVCLSI